MYLIGLNKLPTLTPNNPFTSITILDNPTSILKELMTESFLKLVMVVLRWRMRSIGRLRVMMRLREEMIGERGDSVSVRVVWE